VSFCTTQDIKVPSHTGKGDTMKVSWDLHHLVADEFAV